MRQKAAELPVGERLGQRLAALAARQHGLVTHAQLVALGLDDAAIRRRVRDGRLHRVGRGVYAVGHPELTVHGRFLAAVFGCGPGAALSHESAAVLWGIRPPRGPRIDVTVPASSGRRNRRLVVVYRSAPRPDEVTLKDGVPVTTPARTLLDLAGTLSRRQLERALDQAEYLDLDLRGLAPRQGRRGGALLRAVLASHEAGTTWTRSELEERMLALCRRGGISPPVVNGEVEGFEVDFHWPDQRFAVETDGWSAHRGRGAFERDRVKDAQLVEAGWRVIRITRSRLAREPGAVAAQLARLLYADGSSSSLPVVRRP
jgi:predicted transcriptional regulator of viral defense system